VAAALRSHVAQLATFGSVRARRQPAAHSLRHFRVMHALRVRRPALRTAAGLPARYLLIRKHSEPARSPAAPLRAAAKSRKIHLNAPQPFSASEKPGKQAPLGRTGTSTGWRRRWTKKGLARLRHAPSIAWGRRLEALGGPHQTGEK